MDRWDALLVVVAGYVAVVSLVRLMRARRDQVLSELRTQIAEQRAARDAEYDDRDAA